MRTFARQTACAAPLLGVMAFWGGTLIAERRYPSEFDWRYMTLSNLLSPVRNPAGHLWAAGGMGLTGACGVCWAVALARGSGPVAVGERTPGIWPLGLGSVCMACSGLLPLRLPGVPKGHEILTLFAFAGLCLAMMRLTYQTAKRAFGLRPTGSARRPALYGAALAGVALFPIFLAAAAQVYVFYVLPQLHWVGLSWRARGVPAYFSFAFWEWVTCVVLSAYMAILSRAASLSRTGRFSPTSA